MKKSKLIGLIAGLVMLVLAVGAQAGTYTNFTGSAASIPAAASPVVVMNTIDFSVVNVVTGDVIQVIGVPSNTIVMAVGYEVVTTNSGAGLDTFSIGDDGSAVRFAAATATMATKGSTLASGTAYLYNSDNTIDVTVYGTSTSGKLKVWAVLAPPPQLR